MTTTACTLNLNKEPVLTADQQRAREWLLALALVRASTDEAALPSGMLPRWSTPLLVGPAGGGKAHVCEEVARRWDKPCQRWNVGSWVLESNPRGHSTLEQIHSFILANPQGSVVYLAGVDTLAVKADYSLSYTVAVAGEISLLLDRASARSPRFPAVAGGTLSLPANVLLVVGGCFAALWGDVALGGPEAGEAWKLADQEPLADAAAVAMWLQEHSRLPSNLLRRLAPEPLVLHRITPQEAEQLATRLHAALPPALDGLTAAEFHAALQSPAGWRGVAALIERSWVEGHQPLFSPSPSTQAVATTPAQPALPAPPTRTKSAAALVPVRLGEYLGIPSTRSGLLAHARRLGLRTAGDLAELALARGYLLPGEPVNAAAATPVVERVGRDLLTDGMLMAALLSPCVERDEQAICRGTRMLAVLLATTDPIALVEDARWGRGVAVLRHVARLAVAIYPQDPRWRELLRELPSAGACPALMAGIMPDEAIRRVLSAPLP